jgi:hypothetical protein
MEGQVVTEGPKVGSENSEFQALVTPDEEEVQEHINQDWVVINVQCSS